MAEKRLVFQRQRGGHHAEYVEPESIEFPLLQRDLALHRSAAYNANAEQLRWLFRVFRIGLFMLVVEVAAWVVALAERP